MERTVISPDSGLGPHQVVLELPHSEDHFLLRASKGSDFWGSTECYLELHKCILALLQPHKLSFLHHQLGYGETHLGKSGYKTPVVETEYMEAMHKWGGGGGQSRTSWILLASVAKLPPGHHMSQEGYLMLKELELAWVI